MFLNSLFYSPILLLLLTGCNKDNTNTPFTTLSSNNYHDNSSYTHEFLPDTQAPHIKIKGANPYYLYTNEQFIDPGATAIDDIDGNLTQYIHIESNLDTTLPGTYAITYTVTDHAGNTIQLLRSVIVKEKETKPITVAMVGDQGYTPQTKEVLKLIKEEGSDLLIINGDFGYSAEPKSWEKMHEDILGKEFPIVAIAGNHDIPNWKEYRAILAKWEENPKLRCQGTPGIETTCQFENITIVSTSPGIFDNYDHVTYIQKSLANVEKEWKICSWHKNMTDMQTGNKSNSTGWGVYEACRQAGAFITTGHEHAYARSYLLSNVPNKTVVHEKSQMLLKKGQTVVSLSGLGGKDPREQLRDGYWWASTHNASTGAVAGALFCKFNVLNDSHKAVCYFKDIEKGIVDSFTLLKE